jgi:hypothetical protein
MESLSLILLVRILGVFKLFFQRFSKLPKRATSYLRSVGASRNIGNFPPIKERHEVVEVLNDLILEDGAGSWPPLVNHTFSDWPEALQPYRYIYQELASLLPQTVPSLDEAINTARIAEFRCRFQDLLADRIDLIEVEEVRNCSH